MIGNAAAALQGAPVTTLDVDFMFRATPANLAKLKRFAKGMKASIFRPYYPVSGMYRVIQDESAVQVDFLTTISGFRTFESLRKHSIEISIPGGSLRVATLPDILKSKRAAGRPKDRAAFAALEATIRATQAK